MTGLLRAGTRTAPDSPDLPATIGPAFPVRVQPQEVRETFIRLLGLDAIPLVVATETLFLAENGGATTSRVTFKNSLGEVVPGVLALPSGSVTGLPAIVCVTGTTETAEDLQAPAVQQHGASLHGWARELARRGYATLAITVKGTIARRGSLRRWENENRKLTVWGRSQLGYLAEETIAAARILAALPMVDDRRIGVAGLSLGGIAAWHAMAVAPWLAAAVPICGGLGSLEASVRFGRPDRHSTGMYLPGLLRYFDHGELIAGAVAPRPFYAIAPTEDLEMPKTGVDWFIDRAAPAWAALGRADRFRVDQPPGGHAFKRSWLPGVIDWLDTNL